MPNSVALVLKVRKPMIDQDLLAAQVINVRPDKILEYSVGVDANYTECAHELKVKT